MDYYHIWCDLRPGISDVDFAERLGAYLGHLQREGHIADWRLTRRKLGLGPASIGEFHVLVEVRNLAQLDQAFSAAAARREPVEGLHHAVNSLVTNASFALYRDFPDPVRERGAERF
jgi:hypothetical protein